MGGVDQRTGECVFSRWKEGSVRADRPARCDVAKVAAIALTQPGHSGQAYELTGSELFTIGGMVQVISNALGKPIKYVDIPPIAAKLFMLKTGMDKALVNALMEMLASLRRDEALSLPTPCSA